MNELIEEVLTGHQGGVLTGHNLERESMTGQAAASVLSMEDEIVVRALQPVFHSGLFRVYTNTDLLGCELGGVLKNIIAIAVGMGDGLGAADNTRAGLMTRGLAAITRLGVAMGGRHIGRAHVRTPVTNAHLVCRLLIEKKHHSTTTHS